MFLHIYIYTSKCLCVNVCALHCLAVADSDGKKRSTLHANLFELDEIRDATERAAHKYYVINIDRKFKRASIMMECSLQDRGHVDLMRVGTCVPEACALCIFGGRDPIVTWMA